MKKVGIVLDDWKLPIFKRRLDKAGYKCENFNGPGQNIITLTVMAKTITEVQPIIAAANNEAAQSKKS